MDIFHYTTLTNLIVILQSGGNFWYSKGYYEPNQKKYYLTSLPPETPNSILQRAIFGAGTIITADGTQKRVRGQAYFELNVDGRQLKKTSRFHVFYILASSPNLFFEIIECGQRLGWQTGKRTIRDPWQYGGKLEKYRESFEKKGRISPNGKFLLQGLKKKI